MPALCKPFTDPADAERAVAAVLHAGAPGEDVPVLRGARLHDARAEAAGGFAGTIADGASTGSFGGAAGADPARGGFAGDPGDRPVGVFGNTDRDVVVSHADGAEQVRVAGHHQLVGLLLDAGLDRDTAEADVEALHDGRVLVLARVRGVDAETLRAALDGAAAPA